MLILFGSFDRADTPEKRAWGLMGVPSVSDEYALLFCYPEPTRVSLWMFNVYFDIDAAFLDKEGTILEIVSLTAYPEKMDPERPVNHLEDIYPFYDPICQFFRKKSVTSTQPVYYVLEAKRGYFERNDLRVGDKLDI